MAIILATGFATVRYIQQPILETINKTQAKIDGLEMDDESQRTRLTTLEANYKNIQSTLDRIERQLKNIQ